MENARSGTVVRAGMNWGKIDKYQFYVGAMMAGFTVGVYPMYVVKTRMQVATKGMVDKSAYSGVRGLLRTEGIRGLYRGFGTAMTGTTSSKILFLAAFETTKGTAFKMVEPFKLSDPTKAVVANGIVGMMAFLCFQGVYVPIDVMSQRLMVQGYSGHASYKGGLDVARKVLKQDGIRGLYRGFGLSVMNCSSAAVWGASYFSSQPVILSLLRHGTDDKRSIPSLGTLLLVKSAAGIFACATESCIMTPLDTVKTRLQVMGHEKRPSTRQVIKTLIADEGWKGFYRGFGPRFFATSAWVTSAMLSLEYMYSQGLIKNGASQGRT